MIEEIKNKIRSEIPDSKILNLIFYTTIIIMPFIVIKAQNSKYSLGKLWYLYIIGALLGIIFIKILIQKNMIIKFLKEYKILLVFFISLCVATIYSIDIRTAILGNTVRYEGVIVLFIYVLLLLFSSLYFILNEKLIEIFSISSAIMGGYTVLQLIGIDPIYYWVSGSYKGLETFGLIGHRNFVSTYFVLTILLTLGVYIFYNKKRYLIYSSMIFAGLISSFTRSGWVAFFLSSILGFWFIFKDKQRLKKVVIVILTFIFIFFSLNIISNGRAVSRGKSILNDGKNITESSGSGRVEIWEMTLKSLRNQWLIGTGLDTLHLRFIRDCPEQFIEIIPKIGGYPDKAHNEFLEYWACGGIVTLISYITLVIVILINLLKRIHENKAKILFLMISGYLIQSFFNISVIQVAPIYWILLGVAINYYRKDEILSSEY